MRKILLSFLILLTALLFYNTPAITAYADTGPKPTLDIEVIGIEGSYYLDLLVDGTVNANYSDTIYNDLNVAFVEYADALKTFRNADTNRYWILDGTRVMVQGENLGLVDADHVSFGYMVPTSFQIVIIKENKDIIVTNEVTKKLFYSNMVIDLTNSLSLIEGESSVYEFTGSVVEEGLITDTILGFLYRLFITLVVELLIAIFIFKLTKKQAIITIILFNILTQIILNVVLFNYMGRFFNTIFAYSYVFLNLEIFIICFEMLAYMFIIKAYKKERLLLYAFVANFVTAILTFLI